MLGAYVFDSADEMSHDLSARSSKQAICALTLCQVIIVFDIAISGGNAACRGSQAACIELWIGASW